MTRRRDTYIRPHLAIRIWATITLLLVCVAVGEAFVIWSRA